MRKRNKRKEKKNKRKAFKIRCNKLWKRAREVGLWVNWAKASDAPQSQTVFCLRDDGLSIIPKMLGSIEEIEKYVDTCHKLPIFM